MSSYIQNTFFYGSIGERLNANRKSEIYTNSAKEIRNMIITDLGTLKVAKKFESKEINIVGTVLKVLDTSDNSYILLTDVYIYLIKKDDDSVVKKVNHSYGSNGDITLLGKEYVILYDKTGNQNFTTFGIKDLNYYPDFETNVDLPVKDKKKLQLDIWRVSNDPTNSQKKRIVKMATAEDPLIKIQDNKIYLHNSNIQIKRIYIDYNSVVDIDYFDNPQDGDLYGILRIYYKAEKGNSYIVNNTNVSIGSLTDDTKYKGKYFSQINGDNSEGLFTFGKLLDIKKPTNISFYQDRTIFYKDGYMYFSKIRDYFNFRNGVNSDDPFYCQLNPINNSIGTLLGMIASNGLYVLTTAGIYLIGYGNYLLTPSSIGAGILPITDMGVSNNYDVLNNTIYFMNTNGVLKALTLDTASNQLNYTPHTVDKYSIKNNFIDITRVSIDDKDYIMARSKDNNTMYLIELVSGQEGIFRKIELDFEFTSKPFGLSDRFIIGNKVYKSGNQNYRQAKIIINPPPLNGNNILMDNSSSINSVSVKMLNEDLNSIEGIKISGNNILNLPSQYDMYSIYRIKTKFYVRTGFEIDIFTKENEGNVELQAVQMDLTPIEDK